MDRQNIAMYLEGMKKVQIFIHLSFLRIPGSKLEVFFITIRSNIR